MDQGVIASMKQRYEADLLRTVTDENSNIIALWKKTTVLDAIYSIFQAWSFANPVTLVQSLRKLLSDLK
jgi:hypothetical protein